GGPPGRLCWWIPSTWAPALGAIELPRTSPRRCPTVVTQKGPSGCPDDRAGCASGPYICHERGAYACPIACRCSPCRSLGTRAGNLSPIHQRDAGASRRQRSSGEVRRLLASEGTARFIAGRRRAPHPSQGGTSASEASVRPARTTRRRTTRRRTWPSRLSPRNPWTVAGRPALGGSPMLPPLDASQVQLPRKPQLLSTLRGLLRDVLRLRREGAAYARLTAAQGYADGYMRALVDGGVSTEQELLELVGEVRRGIDGPAVTAVAVDAEQPATAAA